MWSEIALYNIKNNLDTQLIYTIIQDKINFYLDKYMYDLKNKNIKYIDSFLGLGWDKLNFHFLLPINKLQYLSQIAVDNNNLELSFYLNNYIIHWLDNYWETPIKEKLKQSFMISILYKIKQDKFDYFYDRENMIAYIYLFIKKSEENIRNLKNTFDKNDQKRKQKYKAYYSKELSLKRLQKHYNKLFEKNIIKNRNYLNQLNEIAKIITYLSKKDNDFLVSSEWCDNLHSQVLGQSFYSKSFIYFMNFNIIKDLFEKNKYESIYKYLNCYETPEGIDNRAYDIFPINIEYFNFILKNNWITSHKLPIILIFIFQMIYKQKKEKRNNTGKLEIELSDYVKFEIKKFFDKKDLLKYWNINNLQLKKYKKEMKNLFKSDNNKS
jgi:hypothetical protein